MRGPVRRLARCCTRLTVSQIAWRAGCAESTVRRHLQTLPAVGDRRLLNAADRALLAAHLHAPAGLRDAASDPFHKARRAVAANPRLWQRLRIRMLSDPDPVVRANAVGGCDWLPDGAAGRLAGDPAAGVRSAVAARRDVAAAVLARLAADRADSVRYAAVNNPAATAAMIACAARVVLTGDTDSDSGPAAASHPLCPSEILERLANHAAPTVRQAAARNPNTPPRSLAVLAEDPQCAQWAVANPNYPPRATTP